MGVSVGAGYWGEGTVEERDRCGSGCDNMMKTCGLRVEMTIQTPFLGPFIWYSLYELGALSLIELPPRVPPRVPTPQMTLLQENP